MKTKIFVVSGPSGSGKTSILKALFRRKKIKRNFLIIPTCTTRSPRRGEKEAVDYHFLTRDNFQALKKRGFFLESKKFLQDFYGTPKSFLSQARRQKKHPLLCIDVEGALKVKKKFRQRSVLVFIDVPSDKALKARLKKRKTEKQAVLKKRLRIAKKEVKYATKYHYRIVNENFKDTVDVLEDIFLKETPS
ncbi:MAG: guanylate kinase [Candidatus Omnitrophica bacterium]|nr:guanylate kinase [Candidatus Omnitrophota bacterium]